MFSESAAYYDLLYSWKNYAQESQDILKLIDAQHPGAKSVLDIGCGTAEHFRHMQERWVLEGLDLDEGLLTIAQAKFPDLQFHCADMSGFDLGKQYDVLLCLFSSIGYVVTVEKLEATLRCFSRHLLPGGLVVVEPWFTEAQWKSGTVSMLTRDGQDLKICRQSYGETEGNCSILNFHYLVAQANLGVRHLVERHVLGMFTEGQFIQAFEKAGLSVTYDPKGLTGRGLYIGKLA